MKFPMYLMTYQPHGLRFRSTTISVQPFQFPVKIFVDLSWRLLLLPTFLLFQAHLSLFVVYSYISGIIFRNFSEINRKSLAHWPSETAVRMPIWVWQTLVEESWAHKRNLRDWCVTALRKSAKRWWPIAVLIDLQVILSWSPLNKLPCMYANTLSWTTVGYWSAS